MFSNLQLGPGLLMEQVIGRQAELVKRLVGLDNLPTFLLTVDFDNTKMRWNLKAKALEQQKQQPGNYYFLLEVKQELE